MHVINTTAQETAQQAQRHAHSTGNGRMAGTVPSYEGDASPRTRHHVRPESFASQLRAGQQSSQPSQQDDDGFGLDSIVDIVNPLHHIPVVGTIYREITGDELGSVARVAGGALYGGAAGAAAGVGNAALEYASGDDLAGHAMTMLDGGTSARTPSHTPGTSPEARIENAIAAYGNPSENIEGGQQTYTTASSGRDQPAHIRQSSYNG